eukprot:RCo010055
MAGGLLEPSEQLESLLLTFDPVTTDIEQMAALAVEYGSYSVLISMFVRAKGDYTTPLYRLLQVLRQEDHSGASNQKAAQILLAYMKDCLSGVTSIEGPIPEEKLPQLKRDVVDFLFTRAPEQGLAQRYPHLGLFFRYDSSQLLDTLNVTLTDFSSSSPWATTQERKTKPSLGAVRSLMGKVTAGVG